MTTFDSLALLLISLILLLSSVKCCGKVFWTSTTFEPYCYCHCCCVVSGLCFSCSPCYCCYCHCDYCCHQIVSRKDFVEKPRRPSLPSRVLRPSLLIIVGMREIDLSFLPSVFTFVSFYGFGWCSLLITKSETSNCHVLFFVVLHSNALSASVLEGFFWSLLIICIYLRSLTTLIMVTCPKTRFLDLRAWTISDFHHFWCLHSNALSLIGACPRKPDLPRVQEPACFLCAIDIFISSTTGQFFQLKSLSMSLSPL